LLIATNKKAQQRNVEELRNIKWRSNAQSARGFKIAGE